MNPGSIEIFDLNTISRLFTEHKGWESRAICGLSHDPVIRVWLYFSRLEMFHNLLHDIGPVNAKIFKLFKRFEIDSYPTRDKVPRTVEPIHEIYPSKRARFDRRKISTCNSYKYYSIDP